MLGSDTRKIYRLHITSYCIMYKVLFFTSTVFATKPEPHPSFNSFVTNSRNEIDNKRIDDILSLAALNVELERKFRGLELYVKDSGEAILDLPFPSVGPITPDTLPTVLDTFYPVLGEFLGRLVVETEYVLYDQEHLLARLAELNNQARLVYETSLISRYKARVESYMDFTVNRLFHFVEKIRSADFPAQFTLDGGPSEARQTVSRLLADFNAAMATYKPQIDAKFPRISLADRVVARVGRYHVRRVDEGDVYVMIRERMRIFRVLHAKKAALTAGDLEKIHKTDFDSRMTENLYTRIQVSLEIREKFKKSTQGLLDFAEKFLDVKSPRLLTMPTYLTPADFPKTFGVMTFKTAYLKWMAQFTVLSEMLDQVAKEIRDNTKRIIDENRNIRRAIRETQPRAKAALYVGLEARYSDGQATLDEAERKLRGLARDLAHAFETLSDEFAVTVTRIKVEEEILEEKKNFAKYGEFERQRDIVDRPKEFRKYRDELIAALVGLEIYVNAVKLDERIAKRLKGELVPTKEFERLIRKVKIKQEDDVEYFWILWTFIGVLGVCGMGFIVWLLVNKGIVTKQKVKTVGVIAKKQLYNQFSLV